MKTEYKNSIRSKKLIREAVIELLKKEKDFSRINITDVVNYANINRGTFYNHYRNVNDVLAEIENELMNQLMTSLDLSMKTDNTIENFVNSMTEYLKKNEHLYKTIVPYVQKYIVDSLKEKCLQEFKKHYFRISNNDTEKSITLQYVANGVANTYIDYLEGRFDVSLDDLGNTTKKIIVRELQLK